MSDPLKAVHISTVRPPMEVRVFHHECVYLARAGFDVELVIHNGDGGDETVEGVTIRSLGHRAKQRGLLLFSRLKAVLHAARRAQEGAPVDIFQLHDPELIPLGWWLKLTTKSKVIYDSAENYTAYMKQKYFLPAPVRAILAFFMGAMETSAARWFDAIVTADQGTSDIFVRRGAREVVTVHNFPVLGIFDIPPVAEEDKKFDLVYHGSIPRYHLEVAFDVASELKRRGRSPKWLFFGICHDTDWAAEEIRKRGLDGLFEIRGRVNHDQVAPLVAEARIGFIPLPDLPKFQQNIPMKLFEFMTLRMPVVLTNLPPSRPFAGDGKAAIMVTPGAIDEFADAIEKLLDDEPLRHQMGAEGRRRVETEFNWSLESRKLIRLYQHFANEQQSPV